MSKCKKQLEPLQTIVRQKGGVYRFRENKIVSLLLRAGPFDMNKLACMDFSDADHRQFAQLIGYSVSGYGGLSYAHRHESVARADAIVEKMVRAKKRNKP